MAARPEKEKAKYIEKIKIICVGHTEGEHTLPGVAGKYYASRITFLLKHRNNLFDSFLNSIALSMQAEILMYSKVCYKM